MMGTSAHLQEAGDLCRQILAIIDEATGSPQTSAVSELERGEKLVAQLQRQLLLALFDERREQARA